MKIKKDDNVIVISGKDKGKTGKVSKAFPAENKILISGVNVRKSHEKARKSGSKGQIVEKSMPIHVSNVMIVDPKTGKQTRIGKKEVNGKNVRFAKKSGVVLDK
jgi:large subunit ribosomal protein L24